MLSEQRHSQSPNVSLATLESLRGCILGTALGDAAGLKREGLSRDRAIWLHGERPSPDLIFGKGFCSDDTEHTVFVCCSILKSGGDVKQFEGVFAGYLQKWLLTVPAGIGLGTLRAIIKSFFVSSKRYGVFTAGNGPAMRSSLLGLVAGNDSHLSELNRVCTRVTHTDPKAEEAALLVARAARFAAGMTQTEIDSPREFLQQAVLEIKGKELKQHVTAVVAGIKENLSPRDFAESLGWRKGPTGYINQSVPAALYCWASSPNDFRAVVTNAVLLGGDTDSVGAIAGAIAGAGCGYDGLPDDWLTQLAEWPRDKKWMDTLADELHQFVRNPTVRAAPSARWGRTILRNLLFGVVVLALYFRRFIPIPAKKKR